MQENIPADFANMTVEEAIDGDPSNTNNHQVMPSYGNSPASNWNGDQPGLLQDMFQKIVADHAQTQNGITAQNPSDEVSPLPPPDQLGFFHLFQLARSSPSTSLSPWPSSSLLPKPPLSYANLDASMTSSVLYDPLFHLRNLQPQPPPTGELLFPHMGFPNAVDGGEIVIDGEEGTVAAAAMMMMCGEDDGGVLEMMEGGSRVRIGKRRGGNKLTKHFATERDRRTQLNEKYVALGDLIPNPSKFDRASIVGDAIEYIKELLITVNELNLLLERKRWGRERKCKRRRVAVDDEEEQEEEAVDGESSVTAVTPSGDPVDRSFNGMLRSSCLQRKSKATEVDVRIVNDEVTIQLVQRKKKINCLLHVTRVLDELQLDLRHVSGGHIGEHYSFLLNSKICEGSTVYASAIASKVVEVIDQQYYAATPPLSSCGY
ncbi:hypothetical protein BT93_E2692 [Corymbia citriodora subsp. variegata]|nr:hypothetical protein BT93_E2692 [Corymbia citriodora subsp. variegata]